MRDKTSLSVKKNVKLYQALGDGPNRDDRDGRRGAEADGTQTATPLGHPAKHIHPCICDLSDAQWKRIREHRRKVLEAQERYEARLRGIQEELEWQLLAAEELERAQAEEKEFYGDEYQMVGKKRKRLKRSARRASMVSLGVRQVIDSRKPPRIPVKYNEASIRRKLVYPAYCGKKMIPLTPVRSISYEKNPIIPVRLTRSFKLRVGEGVKKQEKLKALEDHRQRFITAFLT